MGRLGRVLHGREAASALIRARPRAPSSLAPVSTIPSSRSPMASAQDSKNTSIEGRENSTGGSQLSEKLRSASTSR